MCKCLPVRWPAVGYQWRVQRAFLCGPLVYRMTITATNLAASEYAFERISDRRRIADDVQESLTAFMIQSRIWHLRAASALVEEAVDDLRLKGAFNISQQPEDHPIPLILKHPQQRGLRQTIAPAGGRYCCRLK